MMSCNPASTEGGDGSLWLWRRRGQAGGCVRGQRCERPGRRACGKGHLATDALRDHKDTASGNILVAVTPGVQLQHDSARSPQAVDRFDADIAVSARIHGSGLLGVHVFGTNATDLVHIGQAIMGCGGTVDYLVDTVLNYPTLSEAYKVAALDVTNKMRALEAFEHTADITPAEVDA